MEINWITDVIMPLSSAVIGGLLALIGVWITLNHEKNERKKEQLDKAKPIIINYMFHAVDKNQPAPKYIFSNDEPSTDRDITGIFKNTDNGILFFDYIETETKRYSPLHSSAVDKNTVFFVSIRIVKGETLKKCIFHCHDIFGTKYYYEASFCFESNRQSELMVGNIQIERTYRKIKSAKWKT